jgi:predicted RNA-binding protein with PIN domain
MAERFLIIDGYNLMHAAGMARQKYGPGELQRCRERFLGFLVDKLSVAEAAAALVVFDAREPPRGIPHEHRIGGVQVLFAHPIGDADAAIEQQLADHGAPSRVTLVSSDRRLQAAARQCRARFVSSQSFFERLERRRDRIERGSRSAPKAGGNPGAQREQAEDSKNRVHSEPAIPSWEVAYWMKVFGDIPHLDDLNRPASTL